MILGTTEAAFAAVAVSTRHCERIAAFCCGAASFTEYVTLLQAVTVAAAGVAVVAGKSAVANEVELASGAGYRETEHVKTYYETARF